MKRKLGNSRQIVSVYDLSFNGGKEAGKHCYLVTVGHMEVLFNLDNALDIVWVKYRGENISFLSKNGLNGNIGEFKDKFEGGFLYTCGMDGINTCVDGVPVHGSLHYQKAEDVFYRVFDDKVIVGGFVRRTALFGKDLSLERCYTVTQDGIEICDNVANNSFLDTKYVLLYHINYGYPFLDEKLKIDMPLVKSEGVTVESRENIEQQFTITSPVDDGVEEVFYNYIKKGEVHLQNDALGINCFMCYDIDDFPVTVQWKSMVSGDYALGIEPSTSRFDDFKMRTIKSGERKKYQIKINFSNIS